MFVERDERRQRGCGAMRPLPGEKAGTISTGRPGGVGVVLLWIPVVFQLGGQRRGWEGNRRHSEARGPWQVFGVWDRGDHELIRPGVPYRD